jgi:hypothetical protein
MSIDASGDLAETLAAFGELDLDRLLRTRGLPDRAPLAQVAEALGSDPDSYARYFLGDPPQEAFWCTAQLPHFQEAVQLWFRDDTVLKLEGAWPELPAERLPATRPATRVLPDGSQEHLWPDHGLAVTTNSSGEVVTSLSVFTPMSEADYLRVLAPFRESRECE